MAQFVTIGFTPSAKKQYRKLPVNIRRKFTKQLHFLVKNYRHPSLRTRKMGGFTYLEARIDKHYRFTFEVEAGIITIRTVGPHDEGLGKN